MVPIEISAEQIAQWQASLPELPQQLRQRFQTQYELTPYDAVRAVSQGGGVTRYFEEMIAKGASPRRAAAWMQQDVLRTLKDRELEIEAFPLSASGWRLF